MKARHWWKLLSGFLKLKTLWKTVQTVHWKKYQYVMNIFTFYNVIDEYGYMLLKIFHKSKYEKWTCFCIQQHWVNTLWDHLLHHQRLNFLTFLFRAQIKLDGKHPWRSIFKSRHSFSVLLSSRLWLGHLSIWMCFNPHHKVQSFKVSQVFFRGLLWSTFPLIQTFFPVPTKYEHPYSIMAPPLCFTE